ncbi:unnamed protein product [Heligmosomoides polygyrus]|uniref:Sushi domain-containing protein n=1 Tax=Heligmosomoides polygyrus TaxID=6339 RepID=A0A183FJ49_HELPZ|nr:unnamed protein product [Heligmosomoides polygyrus]
MDGFPVENGVIAKLRCDAGKYATGDGLLEISCDAIHDDSKEDWGKRRTQVYPDRDGKLHRGSSCSLNSTLWTRIEDSHPLYELFSSTTAICSNGHWIPSSLGMCTDISNSAGLLSCNWVSAPHGMFLSWSPANFGGLILNGTTVRASCINRTPVSGVDELTCTNGAWQPSSFGTCGGKPGSNAGASCAPIAHSAGMVLVYRSGDRYRMGNVLHNLDHGTLLTVKCFNGTLSGGSI